MIFSFRRAVPVAAAFALVGIIAVVLAVNAATHPGHPTAAATPAATNSPTGVAAATPTPVGQSTTNPTPSTAPAADDGPGDAPATASPAPARLAAAKDLAERFTATWLNTLNKGAAEWRAALAGYITPELANQLATADPTTVPTGLIGAPITVTPDGDSLAHVTIPITTGGTVTVTVVLDVQLVSDVDWVKP